MTMHGMMRRGVTLMELLIVVAIVGILATIGYSTYNRTKMESRRVDANSTLISTESIIERYLTENNKKTFDSDDLATSQFAFYDASSSTAVMSKEGYYRITITPDSTGYSITATATADTTLTSCASSGNAQVKQCPDLVCRKIIIDHGDRVSLNSDGDLADAASTLCW